MEKRCKILITINGVLYLLLLSMLVIASINDKPPNKVLFYFIISLTITFIITHLIIKRDYEKWIIFIVVPLAIVVASMFFLIVGLYLGFLDFTIYM